jgi:thioredoxin reductase
MDTKAPSNYDVVIVGGGAAGLSAALVLGRARRRVAVVDAGAPRNAPAAHMQGFLSRDGMPPAELLAVGREEIDRYGVHLVNDEVFGISTDLTVRLAEGTSLTARRLLLATGAVDQLPAIEGARERWGRDFLHCPYCHGWEVRDQPIGVIGTDGASVAHAHLLRQWSDDIVYFTHTAPIADEDRARLDAHGVVIVDGAVHGLSVTDDRLEAIELADGRSVRRTALFMRPTLKPRLAGLIETLGCATDENGFVRVDHTGRTTVPTVWAAGNAADPRAQVITAAGAGSAAAIAINTDLLDEDIRTLDNTQRT